ncbi:MAG: hypothetical protein U5Q16_00745 [Gammaproteobacteria bacterium]|nr:hypothetical protein [Gammaproteobacteria bacterium]
MHEKFGGIVPAQLGLAVAAVVERDGNFPDACAAACQCMQQGHLKDVALDGNPLHFGSSQGVRPDGFEPGRAVAHSRQPGHVTGEQVAARESRRRCQLQASSTWPPAT